MSVCVLKHFLVNIEDQVIEDVVTYALDLSQQHTEIIQGIFTDEEIPIPQGFSEQDVNLKAKRLFSDIFYLYYLKNMAKGGLATYASIIPTIYRNDISAYYSKSLKSSLELHSKINEILLDKGLAVRPPTIPYPQMVEFVHKESFIIDRLGRKTLTGVEATNLYKNILTNQLGTCIATAFSQVVQSNKVRDLILRGKNISTKHIKVLSDYLANNGLPVPMSIDQEITESRESPFSDKLMIFYFGIMNYIGIGNYGLSISESVRSDLVVDYTRLMTEAEKYAEDVVNFMIGNEWLEQPPLAADRKELAMG